MSADLYEPAVTPDTVWSNLIVLEVAVLMLIVLLGDVNVDVLPELTEYELLPSEKLNPAKPEGILAQTLSPRRNVALLGVPVADRENVSVPVPVIGPPEPEINVEFAVATLVTPETVPAGAKGKSETKPFFTLPSSSSL